MADSKPPSFDLLKLHTDEVRFQVQLNWDRAKSSLTFHVALLALIAGLQKLLAGWFVVLLFLFVAASAVLSAGILYISHGYYRAARDRRRQVELELGLERLGFSTTPGMSGAARRWPTVTNILLLLHAMLAAVSLAGAWVYRP